MPGRPIRGGGHDGGGHSRKGIKGRWGVAVRGSLGEKVCGYMGVKRLSAFVPNRFILGYV